MARYFTQGTFTTETNYADAVRKAMVTGFTSAIAAGKSTWSVIDDGYVNTNFERTVFTCTSGTGFSILVGNHSTSTTTHTFNSYIGKTYDLATHTLQKVGFSLLSGIQGPAGTDSYSTTDYNPTNVQTTSTPTMHNSYNNVIIPTTISNWFLVVEDDYAVFSIKDGTSGIGTVWYFGAFDTAVTNPSFTDNAPYGLFQNGSSGIFDRSLIILHSLNNAGKTIHHGAALNVDTSFVGRPASAAIYDIYKSGTKSVLSKINIFRHLTTLTSVTNPNSDGHHRGTLKGVAYASPTGAAWGDQIDVNGVTYLYGGGIASTVGTSGSTSAMAWWVAIN